MPRPLAHIIIDKTEAGMKPRKKMGAIEFVTGEPPRGKSAAVVAPKPLGRVPNALANPVKPKRKR